MNDDLLVGQMHIACVSNAAYVPHFATMLNTLAASHRPTMVAVHFVHDETVTPQIRRQLAELAERLGISLAFYEPTEDLLAELPPRNSHYPQVVWFNILLPELLQHLDRVLYIDGDTLVMQDLRPLWSTDLGDALFAAVAQPVAAARDMEMLTRLHLEPDAPYLNSGVILMDLRQMRAEDVTRKTLAVGRSQLEQLDGGKLLYLMDQDALNAACVGRWLQLHPRWNALAVLYLDRTIADDAVNRIEFAEAAASPAIVHFEGPVFAKPWNYRCVHPFQPLYLAYRRDTPWPLETLDDSGLLWKVLRPLPSGIQLWLVTLKKWAERLRARAA